MLDAETFLMALQGGASSTVPRFVSLSKPFANNSQFQEFLNTLRSHGPSNAITGIRLQANLGDVGAADLAAALACCIWLETLELPGRVARCIIMARRF